MSDEKKMEFRVTQTGQVVNAAGQVVTINPKPAAGRPWIKVWTNQWLDGTTRWQMTGAQRAFWVDLCCESGRGRFPGFVCAGQDAGQIVGYPLHWYAAKQAEQFDIMETFRLFERTGKIRIIVTSESPLLLIAIEILNWDVYQPVIDDAERSRNYRDRKSKSQKKTK